MTKILKNCYCWDHVKEDFDYKSLYIQDGVLIDPEKSEIEKNTIEIDNLKGKYLYPAFVDSHLHLLGVGSELRNPPLNDVDAPEILRELIRADERETILLRGWDEEKLGFIPDRDFLDNISNKKNIILIRKCGHIGTVNTPAINAFQLEETGNIDNSELSRGLLKERGLNQALEKIVNDKRSIAKNLITAAEKLKKEGITSVHSDDYHSVRFDSLIEILQRQREIRIFEKVNPNSMEELQAMTESGVFSSHNTEFLRVKSVKVFLDGSFGGRTALLTAPYEDTPTRGIAYMTSDEFAEYVHFCERNELQLIAHVIGDGALKIALEGFEKAISSQNPLRHRLVHLQMASREQLSLIKRLDLRVSIQPIFFDSDFDMGQRILGKKRFEEICYPFRKALDMGIKVSLSTDSPVEKTNPIINMVSALRFMDLNKAFYSYTVAGAEAAFMETELGQLRPGFKADAFLHERNIFQMNTDEIRTTKPENVLYNGQWIFNL